MGTGAMTIFKMIPNRARVLVRECCEWRSGPMPHSGMLRAGFAVVASYLTFRLMGQIEGAVIAAIFTNLLCLNDRAQRVRARLWVTWTCAVLSICAGAVGTLIAGNDPLILLTLFALALFAGFIHGTLPGVESIPRYTIICFIVAAYLPVGTLGALAAASVATTFTMAAIYADDWIRNGRARSLRAEMANAAVTYPGPRFSIAYGTAAVCALGIGLIWGQTRPYWITITTLAVMQPDRRANMVRVIQRLTGTLLGVICAFGVVHSVPGSVLPGLLLIAVLALPFLWPFGFERNYGFGMAILSLWILLLIDSALPPGELAVPLFFARLSDTAIGCAMALAGSLFVFETRDEKPLT